jgi:hypothetical protein
MSTSRAPVSKIRTLRPISEDGALEGLWGVAVCRGCGATIVLAERASHSQSPGTFGLCSTCVARPAAVAVSASTGLLAAGTGIREVSTAPTVSGVRDRDAA